MIAAVTMCPLRSLADMTLRSPSSLYGAAA
jgi:hypothetical protein